MQRPFIHPYAYSILIMMYTTIIAVAVFISLLLLLHYCYCYKTVTTDKLLRASLFSGAAELTAPSTYTSMIHITVHKANIARSTSHNINDKNQHNLIKHKTIN